MKLIKTKSSEAGSAILVSLILVTILAVSVASYMAYIEQQSLLGSRSQTWNLALGLTEAGVEEALQHLNSNSGNLSADGWYGEGNTYYMTRYFEDRSYTVSIDASNPNVPVILSRAYVTPPRFVQNGSGAIFATAGSYDPNAGRINRAVRVIASRSSMFLAAMVAKKQIDLNGNNVTSDSFDSEDITKSTNGRWDPAKAQDNGDVASNAGIVSAVSVQNANIYGRVYTGPNGTATIGSQGGVGTHAWQATNKGFQPGYVLNTANFTFPDTKLPYNSGLYPGPGDVVTVTGSTTNSTTQTSTTYPSAPPSGYLGPITTNTTVVTTTIFPSPVPAGLATNATSYITVATYPSPAPAGITTNYTTTSASSLEFPSPGTYLGSITTNIVTSGPKSGRGTWYVYNSITGITSYTYPTTSYSYQTKTYTYTTYESVPTYVTNSYDHVIGNGDYYATSISGSIVVVGKGRLVLPNGLNMGNSDGFTIVPGGSVRVYAGGTQTKISGNGVLNPSGYAANFIVYSAPSVTSFTLDGNGEFTGVLVAPNADLKMNGGGNSLQDFTGALMVNSVTMNGHFNFHYDEALGRMASNGRYLIQSWAEVD